MAMAFSFLFPSHDINNMPGVGPDAKTRTKVLHSFRLSARSGWENGKTFAKMGVIWSGAECVLEVVRRRSDSHSRTLLLAERCVACSIARAMTCTMASWRAASLAPCSPSVLAL